MAELIESIDIHEVSGKNILCYLSDNPEYQCLLPTRIGIPLFKDAITIIFQEEEIESTIGSCPVFCLQVNTPEKKILEAILDIEFEYDDINIVTKDLYLLEKIHAILEKRDEYIDVLYCFAGVEEYSGQGVKLDQFVSSRVGINGIEDIVEIYRTIMYEIKIGRRNVTRHGILSICIDNIYVKVDMPEEAASFYVRVPIRIRDLLYVDIIDRLKYYLETTIGHFVGWFTLCRERDSWNVPLIDIEGKVLKDTPKNFLEGDLEHG